MKRGPIKGTIGQSVAQIKCVSLLKAVKPKVTRLAKRPSVDRSNRKPGPVSGIN